MQEKNYIIENIKIDKMTNKKQNELSSTNKRLSRTEYIKENWYKLVNVSTLAVVLGYVVYGAK